MPRQYVKKGKDSKRLKVIVANPKTPDEYGKMIDNLNKVLRELYSAKEVGQKRHLNPFGEGNGRSQRIFIESLAKINCINLDLTNVSK